MARLLYHDMALETEYAISLDAGTCVQAGWWEALLRQLEQGTDYVGHARWHDYSPTQVEAIRTCSWYLGVPFDRREGRHGIWFVPWGFMAIRSDRLREADFPDLGSSSRGNKFHRCGDDVLLGEMARQLGWKRAEHKEFVTVKQV